MAKIHRAPEQYSQISNEIINDTSLSLQARFIYVWMYSKPTGWEFFMKGIMKGVGLGEEAVRKYMKELIEAGWIMKSGQSYNNGRYGANDYFIAIQKGEFGWIGEQDEEPELDEEPDAPEPTPAKIMKSHGTEPKKITPKNKPTVKPSQIDTYVEDIEDNEWKALMYVWLEYKRERKEQYKTKASATACLKKLQNFSDNDKEVACDIIETAIANNWAGFFKPESKKSSPSISKQEQKVGRHYESKHFDENKVSEKLRRDIFGE